MGQGRKILLLLDQSDAFAIQFPERIEGLMGILKDSPSILIRADGEVRADSLIIRLVHISQYVSGAGDILLNPRVDNGRIERIGQEANSCEDAQQNGSQNDPETGFLIAKYIFYPLCNTNFSKGQRAGGDGAVVDAAFQQRLRVIRPGLPAQRFHNFFVTGQFDIPAKKNISEPHQGIEPVDGQQKKAKRFPPVVLSADMGFFVGDDVGDILFRQEAGQKYFRTE